MNKTEREHYARMTAQIYEHGNKNTDFAVIDELAKISRSLRNSYTNSCMYELSPRQQTRENNLEKKAKDLAELIGAILYLQTDPRGASIYLLFPAHYADWDNTRYSSLARWIDSNYTRGICVY